MNLFKADTLFATGSSFGGEILAGFQRRVHGELEPGMAMLDQAMANAGFDEIITANYGPEALQATTEAHVQTQPQQSAAAEVVRREVDYTQPSEAQGMMPAQEQPVDQDSALAAIGYTMTTQVTQDAVEGIR